MSYSISDNALWAFNFTTKVYSKVYSTHFFDNTTINVFHDRILTTSFSTLSNSNVIQFELNVFQRLTNGSIALLKNFTSFYLYYPYFSFDLELSKVLIRGTAVNSADDLTQTVQYLCFSVNYNSQIVNQIELPKVVTDRILRFYVHIANSFLYLRELNQGENIIVPNQNKEILI